MELILRACNIMKTWLRTAAASLGCVVRPRRSLLIATPSSSLLAQLCLARPLADGFIMLQALSIALSYLIGSIPNAYILGKLIKGIDIRKFGSGNVGATNAFRVLGPVTGIVVLLLDALKGFVCVVILSDYFIKQGVGFDGLLLRILLGVVSVLGHSLSIFLRFKGGKGMATTLGVLIGLAIKGQALRIILGLEIAIWLIVFLLTRIVSLSSLISAVFFPIFCILFKQPPLLVIMSFVLSILIIFRHKSNIYRLLHNQESRLKIRKAA